MGDLTKNVLAAESAPGAVPVSAIVTAYKRIPQTIETIKRLQVCVPRPDEILVHVDAQERDCEAAIRNAFPEIKLIVSSESIGPGGGRNKLIKEAKNEFVASFDDDSYPIDEDYFARILILFEKFPNASILTAAIYHLGESVKPDLHLADWSADFVGCGCVYRKQDFLRSAGYVPLTIAYSMEEVDLALRYRAAGMNILYSSWLRIHHDTRLIHHSRAPIVAGSIANLALLAFLRYPVILWPLGILQCLNRVRYLMTRGSFDGILQGIFMIPSHCWSKRSFRKVIGYSIVKSYRNHRKAPVDSMPVGLPCLL